MIAGLVLAAGAGTRLGTPKALVRYDGELLLDRAVTTLAGGGCDTVVAVLGAEERRVRASAVREFHPVSNPNWRNGMGSSLRAGLCAMPSQTDTVIILLVDQPGITAAAVRRVLAEMRRGADIAQGGYHGAPGHPVAFARRLWPEVIANARGDRGARGLLRRHRDRVVAVPCEDIADDGDIDTPRDLAKWGASGEQPLQAIDPEVGEEHQRQDPQ